MQSGLAITCVVDMSHIVDTLTLVSIDDPPTELIEVFYTNADLTGASYNFNFAIASSNQVYADYLANGLLGIV